MSSTVRCVLGLTLALHLFGEPALSQNVSWISLGLQFEEITCLATDTHSDSLLYASSASDFSAGTQGGIFRSTNWGRDWDTLFRGASVAQIVIHPDSSNILFAALANVTGSQAGIIKSIDGGGSWFRADTGLALSSGNGVLCVLIDPVSPNILIAGTGGFGGGGLYRSIDGGTRWNRIVDSTANIRGSMRAIGLTHWFGPRYLASNNYGELFLSDDAGESWRSLQPLSFSNSIGFQFISSGRDSVIYHVRAPTDVSPKGVFASHDGGDNWMNIGSSLPGVYAFGWCVAIRSMSASEELFLGASTFVDYGLDSGRIGGVFMSNDGGATWQKYGLDSASIRTLVVSADGSRIYAGAYSAYLGVPLGVYRADIPTAVMDDPSESARSVPSLSCFPNPFNSVTTLSFTIESQATVTLEVFDIMGARIRTLVAMEYDAGRHVISWDGKDERGITVATGLYMARLRAGGTSKELFTASVRMVMLK